MIFIDYFSLPPLSLSLSLSHSHSCPEKGCNSFKISSVDDGMLIRIGAILPTPISPTN